MAKAELNWLAVDTKDLTEVQRELYSKYEKAKHEFELKMIGDAQVQKIISGNQSLAFAYRRGLAIAIVERKAQASWGSLAKA